MHPNSDLSGMASLELQSSLTMEPVAILHVILAIQSINKDGVGCFAATIHSQKLEQADPPVVKRCWKEQSLPLKDRQLLMLLDCLIESTSPS